MESPGMTAPCVSMRNITKRFHGTAVPAVRDVSLDLYPGEIHCIAGENGSGKSTLMHILSGYLQFDGGEISNPENRIIRMVHQAPITAEDVRVREHLLLSHPALNKRPFLHSASKKRIAADLSEYPLFSNLADNLETFAGELKPQLKHHLSLASAVLGNPDILILDEPSAHLSTPEKEILLGLLRSLRSRGKTIVLITHKLDELKLLGDRVTVLRRGRLAGHFQKDSFLESEMAGLLIDHSGELKPRPKRKSGGELIAFEHVSAVSGRERISDISFVVKAGEVLGIIGLRGEGLDLLEKVLAGLVQYARGEIRLKGRRMHRLTPRLLRKNNVGYIPTDRLLMASTANASIEDNLILLEYRNLHTNGIFKRDEINRLTSSLYKSFNIRGNAPKGQLKSLSGGNIQRVIVSREISGKPDIVIFAEPYWGLDAEGKALIKTEIRKLQARGSAVILLSPEAEEILDLSDTFLILYEGETAIYDSCDNLDFGLVSKALLGTYRRPG